jgi:hypothetical protein
MKACEISEIAVDASGRLLVKPALQDAGYSLVYRSGKGLRWDALEKAFVASEPARWEQRELLEHILRNVQEEYGEQLVASGSTLWKNVPQELRTQLWTVLVRLGAADA